MRTEHHECQSSAHVQGAEWWGHCWVWIHKHISVIMHACLPAAASIPPLKALTSTTAQSGGRWGPIHPVATLHSRHTHMGSHRRSPVVHVAQIRTSLLERNICGVRYDEDRVGQQVGGRFASEGGPPVQLWSRSRTNSKWILGVQCAQVQEARTCKNASPRCLAGSSCCCGVVTEYMYRQHSKSQKHAYVVAEHSVPGHACQPSLCVHIFKCIDKHGICPAGKPDWVEIVWERGQARTGAAEASSRAADDATDLAGLARRTRPLNGKRREPLAGRHAPC